MNGPMMRIVMPAPNEAEGIQAAAPGVLDVFER
jgi:hypothetical protein